MKEIIKTVLAVIIVCIASALGAGIYAGADTIIGKAFEPGLKELELSNPNHVRLQQHISCAIEQQEAWLAIVRDNQHRPEYIMARWKVRSSIIQASLNDMSTANRNYLYR